MKLGLQTQTYVRKMNLSKIEDGKLHSIDFDTACYNIYNSVTLIIYEYSE
jgi:hypothetical protein